MKNPVKDASTATLKQLGKKYYNINNPSTVEMTMFNLIIEELKERLSEAEFTVWAVNA